jgi:hypothetical protein
MLTRTRRRALIALVPLALVPLLVAATHGSKKLTALTCNSTITTSTTLSADLSCPGSGVVIGADHVTLNLNGHRISGSGSNDGVFSDNIGVVVENGSISGFNLDVQLQGASSRVTNLRVSGATSNGIDVSGQNTVVSGNRVFGNGNNGIGASGAGSQYTNNILQSNGNAGLGVTDPSVISGNKVLNNASYGIFFRNDAGGSVAVTNNLANGNQNGIFESVNDATVVTLSGNKAYFNTQLGIAGRAGVNDGGNNKASGNGSLAQCTNVVCS